MIFVRHLKKMFQGELTQPAVVPAISDDSQIGNSDGYVANATMNTALSSKMNTPSGTVNQYIDGTGALQSSFPAEGYDSAIGAVTKGAFPAFVSLTTASNGQASFDFNTIFPNAVFPDSVQPVINSSTTIYIYSWTWGGANNKVLTVTVNQSTNTSVLTLLGISLLSALGVAPANVNLKLMVWGY